MTKALQKCHGTQLSEIVAPVKAPRGVRRWPTAIMRIARQRTATSRRARPRWRRSPRAGDGNSQNGTYLSGKLSGSMFQTVLSIGRSGRILTLHPLAERGALRSRLGRNFDGSPFAK